MAPPVNRKLPPDLPALVRAELVKASVIAHQCLVVGDSALLTIAWEGGRWLLGMGPVSRVTLTFDIVRCLYPDRVYPDPAKATGDAGGLRPAVAPSIEDFIQEQVEAFARHYGVPAELAGGARHDVVREDGVGGVSERIRAAVHGDQPAQSERT